MAESLGNGLHVDLALCAILCRTFVYFRLASDVVALVVGDHVSPVGRVAVEQVDGADAGTNRFILNILSRREQERQLPTDNLDLSKARQQASLACR